MTMDLSKLNNMKFIPLTLITLLGLTSCNMHMYKNEASLPISMGMLNLGMDRKEVLSKLGEPFSHNSMIVNHDTISTLCYKTPKVVANCEYIVTTKLRFNNNILGSITQLEFFVPEHVILCDSTMSIR